MSVSGLEFFCVIGKVLSGKYPVQGWSSLILLLYHQSEPCKYVALSLAITSVAAILHVALCIQLTMSWWVMPFTLACPLWSWFCCSCKKIVHDCLIWSLKGLLMAVLSGWALLLYPTGFTAGWQLIHYSSSLTLAVMWAKKESSTRRAVCTEYMALILLWFIWSSCLLSSMPSH